MQNLKLNLAILSFVAAGLAGCGGSQAKLTGQVTLDNEPLAEGSILLIPTDGKGTAAGGAIKDGKFSLTGAQAPGVGNYKVEIRASKKSGGKVQKAMGQPGEMVDEFVEAVAPHFNSQTTLRVDVKRGGAPVKFEVFSK